MKTRELWLYWAKRNHTGYWNDVFLYSYSSKI